MDHVSRRPPGPRADRSQEASGAAQGRRSARGRTVSGPAPVRNRPASRQRARRSVPRIPVGQRPFRKRNPAGPRRCARRAPKRPRPSPGRGGESRRCRRAPGPGRERPPRGRRSSRPRSRPPRSRCRAQRPVPGSGELRGAGKKWGFSQLHASYFDMATGIVDGTRDSATGVMERQVTYPTLVNPPGFPFTYEIPTRQESMSYTPFVINQRIRHIKAVWDNSVAVGEGHITGTFSFQRNLRQETNDPTQPNTPDIYYASSAATYDLRYVSKQYGGFNFSTGVNGAYQASESLGTVMLIPNYNFFQVGAFAIGNYQVGKLALSGGIRFDNRTFTGESQWISTDTTSPQVPVAPNTPNSFEELKHFTSNFSGVSGSLGATYSLTKARHTS